MDLSNICFVCLIPNQLHNNNILLRDDDGVVLADKLKVILLELVDFRPDIPKYLCNICSQELNYVYNFRLKGLKSITTLNEYLAKIEAPGYKNDLVPEETILPVKSENQNTNQSCLQSNTDLNIAGDESETNYKNTNIIEECNPTVPPVSVFIKTEIDETLENENTQSSFDENVEDNSTEESVNVINNSKSSFFPVYIREDNQISSSLYSTASTDSNNLEDPDYQNESNKKRHKCTECHKAFISGRDLRRHIRTHTGERPYECEICHRAFGEKYTLKNHKRTHKTVKPTSEANKTDGAVSADTESTQLKVDDSSEKRYKCDLCEKSFFIPALLKRHMLTHTGERPFKCSACHLTFKQSYNLTKHIRGAHFGDKPYVCSVCGKAFCDNSSLKNHQRSHQQPFKCGACERGFADQARLDAHELTHNSRPGGPHVCEVCQMTFGVIGSLQKHMQRKHK